LKSYRIFQEFLLKKNIIKKKLDIELFIKPWLYNFLIWSTQKVLHYL
jgi:hypothetical protein